jgi:hypothetical protein
LQKAEAQAKTGLLIIKQDEQRVELSFRQGQLMCIGPVRSSKTLGERLLQAGVISPQALQEVAYILGPAQQSETRTAISLIDLGYLNEEKLRAWAAMEASRVLEALLVWTTGEIYFQEEQQPPADRLLIALSITSLLSQQTAVSTPRTGVFSTQAQELSVPFASPKRVTEPLRPRRFDTSQMQPQMVMTPTNLSGIREQNSPIQLTPEQWRLFTRADGKCSLQMACQQLIMSREIVCQVAGELLERGLVTITMPVSGSTGNQSPVPQRIMIAEFNNHYTPQVTGSNRFSPAPIETHSQWGNGGNGATFVLGGGWVVASSPSQSLLPVDPDSVTNNIYAQAGGVR